MPASSKLLPLKHADEVRVGLCVASGCSALRGKTCVCAGVRKSI